MITQQQINEAIPRYRGKVTHLPDDRTTLNQWSAIPRPHKLGLGRKSVEGWNIDKVFTESRQFQPTSKDKPNDDTKHQT